MINEVFINELEKIFTDNLGVRIADLDADKPLHEQVALDSMHLIGMVAKVEHAFSIELPLSVLQIQNLSELYQVIEACISSQKPGGGIICG